MVDVMAIVMRRGAYKDFDPSKMSPGEWAVVLANDPVVSDGRSVFICFSAGNVKRMATYEDMVDQFGDMTDDIVEQLTNDVNAVILVANGAAEYARTNGDNAKKQAQQASEAAKRANNVAEDLISRRDSGEFKGEKGDQGDKGDQGESGVMAPTSGMFSLYLDPQTGNLYAEYPDGSNPPQFEYDSETGNLYYITDEEVV